MTFLVKCDHCGKTQEAKPDHSRWPSNPLNEEGTQWYSRYDKDQDKTIHACCLDHIKDRAVVWPESLQ